MNQHADHENTQETPAEEPRRTPISRRLFLKGSGAAAASTAAAVTAAGATSIGLAQHAFAQDATPTAMTGMGGAVSGQGETPLDADPSTAVLFFTVDEAKLVDALASRILPGTADDPGAHEAGVVFYIDRVLSGPNLGWDYKTYQQGPFGVVAETPTTVEASSTRDLYQASFIPAENASRYGFQSPMTPPETYRRGLAAVNAYSQSKLKKNFVDLAAADQDGIK